jgi:hypothetical protein
MGEDAKGGSKEAPGGSARGVAATKLTRAPVRPGGGARRRPGNAGRQPLRRGSRESLDRGGRKREEENLPRWREVMQFCIMVGGGGTMPISFSLSVGG